MAGGGGQFDTSLNSQFNRKIKSGKRSILRTILYQLCGLGYSSKKRLSTVERSSKSFSDNFSTSSIMPLSRLGLLTEGLKNSEGVMSK